jgi:histidine triad (HIT) family protein
MTFDPTCIFCKIVAGQIPCRKVFEDDELLAFHDINPWAPVHFLIVPKTHIVSLMDVDGSHQQMLGKMLLLAPKLALEQGIRPGREGGMRIVINNGRDGGQEVDHLHMHVMGGPRPWLRG